MINTFHARSFHPQIRPSCLLSWLHAAGWLAVGAWLGPLQPILIPYGFTYLRHVTPARLCLSLALLLVCV